MSENSSNTSVVPDLCTIEFETIIRKFWEWVLVEPINVFCEYSGNLLIGQERYWLLKTLDCLIPGASVLNFFTTTQCIPHNKTNPPMTSEEFFTYYSTGKCSIFTFALVSLLNQLLNSSKPKYTILLKNKKITRVGIVTVTITKQCEIQVNCYEDEKGRSKKNHTEWDCDRLSKKNHQVLAIYCEEPQAQKTTAFIVDITHFQYGVKDKMKGCEYPYLVKKFLVEDDDDLMYSNLGYGLISEVSNDDVNGCLENDEKSASTGERLHSIQTTKQLIARLLKMFKI